MLFTFPSATIASISGAALVATLSSRDVAANASFPSKPFKSSFGSFGARSAALGDECSTVKVLRANPDIGILRCGPDGICVEDASSLIGGSCVAHDEAETLVDVTPGVQSLVPVSGIPCTFTNGTEGFKCVGKNACPMLSNETAGCGSCIGDYSCFELTEDVTIGENSCVGFSACDVSSMPSLVVGDNSCIGLLACTSIDGDVTIGDNSCIGYYPCMSVSGSASSTNIGSNSCHYNEACKYLEGTVGNDSCIGTSVHAMNLMVVPLVMVVAAALVLVDNSDIFRTLETLVIIAVMESMLAISWLLLATRVITPVTEASHVLPLSMMLATIVVMDTVPALLATNLHRKSSCSQLQEIPSKSSKLKYTHRASMLQRARLQNNLLHTKGNPNLLRVTQLTAMKTHSRTLLPAALVLLGGKWIWEACVLLSWSRS
eukprot:CCRYP_018263-RA/>CCRYP_018263-RA protein AED:0.11 eAED:0.11 QI:129/1/1/1/0.5/0.2/5/290/430